MKKFLTLLLLLIASVSLVSCNEKPDIPGDIDDPTPGDVTENPNIDDDENPDDNEDEQLPDVPAISEDDYNSMFESIERYIRSFIKNTTNKDQKLKNTYYKSGAEITYVSSKPEFVTNEGLYIKHEYDEEVTLTCTVKWEGRVHTFDINFISVGIDDSEKLIKVKSWIENYLTTTKLTEGTVLPTTHPNYGGRIRWVCEQPDVIIDYKTLNLPVHAGTYRLIAEYTFNSPSAYEIVNYRVKLDATTLSMEERVKNFVKQSLIATEGDFFNLYEGSTPVVNRSLLIDINDEKIVSHVQSGVMSAVSQDFLDQEIYKGYKLKNKEQIVWIVVHESGMNTTGVNAERLAKTQHNSAYQGSSRDASWQYQVDDGEIYQSYEDNIYCWHASAKRGNSNSIGIEMCVNPDGQFNAAMRNDARLIASFLIKYELGMLNVKQHFNFDPNGKNCPENIRNDFRWFELMGMITREYTSQTLLKDVDINYEVLTEGVTAWKLPGIYRLSDSKDIKVRVTVFGETFDINATNE